jgi:nucleotide-binding universal stress UspA family protein
VPILLHFGTTLSGLPTPQFSTALWICFGLAAGGAVLFTALYVLGGVRPVAPALQRWMGGQDPAWESPPLLAVLRQGAVVPAPAVAPAAAGGGSSGQPAVPTGHHLHPTIHHYADHEGPVLFAYDGSDLADEAIAEAGRQLPARRDALVLTVWRTFGVGFIPEPDAQFDAACADDVRQAAEQTAARGVRLADAAGFRADALTVQATPAWRAVLDTANEHDASLIVIGSHRHAGLGGLVSGSVADDVTARSKRPVLIIHPRKGANGHASQSRATAADHAVSRRLARVQLTRVQLTGAGVR